MRKTIPTAKVIDNANSFLSNSHDSMVAERRAVHSFVTNLLMDMGCYKGFNYLEESEVPPGQSFGKVYIPGQQSIFKDESRTKFYQ